MAGRGIWNVRRAIFLWVINSRNHNHQTIYDVSLANCFVLPHVTDVQRTEKHIWTNLSVEFHMVKSYSEYGSVVFFSAFVLSVNATQRN